MKTYSKIKSVMLLLSLLVFIETGASFSNITQPHMPVDVEIEGIWQGTLKFSGTELQIIFTISRSADKILTATMDVPEQGASAVPIDEIIFENRNVRLEIIPIEGIFEGKLAEDGKKIDGNWSQGGMSLPLLLERAVAKTTLNRPQEPEEPFPYKVEEVIFKNHDADIILAGTLTFPSSEEPFPAVLLLSGSGPQDRDEAVFGHRPFLILADYLTRKGLVVLRVDDRGVGGSSGNFEEATAEDYAADAMAGVAYLKSRKEINRELIGLIGHSEGGLIASMSAAKSSDIAFVVLIASPGLPIVEMEYSEQARGLKANGADENFIARNQALQENLFEVLRQETDGEAVHNKFISIITEFFEALSEEERKIAGLSKENLKTYIQDQVQRLHSPWFRFYLPYDPGSTLRKVTCPVLAINGEKDQQVPSKDNLNAIKQALEVGGNNNYIIKELPGLNHLLQTAETGSISEYGKIEETMSPSALQIIGDWIQVQTITQ